MHQELYQLLPIACAGCLCASPCVPALPPCNPESSPPPKTSIKALDPHANEYMDRLKDETVLLALAQKVSVHLETCGGTSKLAGVALRRIDHLYYKTGELGRGKAGCRCRCLKCCWGMFEPSLGAEEIAVLL